MDTTIYYYEWCGYSQQAIKLCKKLKIDATLYDMESKKCGGKDNVIKALKRNGFIPKNSKHNTAPIVFINGKFIGGYSEFLKFVNK